MKRSILITDEIDSMDKMSRNRSKTIRQIGIELAKRTKNKVDFLFVEDFRDLSSLEALNYAKGIHDNNLSNLKKIKKSLKIPISTHLKSGSASQEIIKFINRNPQIEITVMGTHGNTGLKKLFLGSVAEEVLRHSKKPIMTLGPKVKLGFKFPKDIKILLATDLTNTSTPAEKYGLNLSARLKSQITLFYSQWEQMMALQHNAYATDLPVFIYDETVDKMKRGTSKLMQKKVEKYKQKKFICQYKITDQTAPLDKLITEEAKEGGYSLIIMGTHNRNKLMKAFLGSTARKVILNSPIPVITVRS